MHYSDNQGHRLEMFTWKTESELMMTRDGEVGLKFGHIGCLKALKTLHLNVFTSVHSGKGEKMQRT